MVRGDVVRREDVEEALQDVDQVVHLAAETGTGQSMYEIARYEGQLLRYRPPAGRPREPTSPGEEGRPLLVPSIYGEGQYRCAMHGIVQPAPRPVRD